MNISPEEAQEALASVQQVRDRTNQTLSRGALYEVLWGTVWVVGFLISQFVPSNSGTVLSWTWGALGILGGIISLGIGVAFARQTSVPRTSGSWFDSSEARFGLLFWALVIYSSVLFAIFLPFLLHALPNGQAIGLPLSLWWVVTFSFGFAAVGLWFRLSQLIGIGAVVTAIGLLGYYLLPGDYYLLMALFGGGTLVVHGLYWLHPWRR